MSPFAASTDRWLMIHPSFRIPIDTFPVAGIPHPVLGHFLGNGWRLFFFFKLENPWAASGQGVAWFAQPQLFHWNGKQFFFRSAHSIPARLNSTTTSPWVVKFFYRNQPECRALDWRRIGACAISGWSGRKCRSFDIADIVGFGNEKLFILVKKKNKFISAVKE